MGRQDVNRYEAWGPYAVQLGAALRQAREARQLSQEYVAYRAGLTRGTYMRYEAGLSVSSAPANPSLRSLLALSQVLEVPITELVPPEVPDLRAW